MTKIDPETDRQFRLARLWSNDQLRQIAPIFNGVIVNVSAGENIDKQSSTYDLYFSNKQSFWVTNYAPGTFRGFNARENEYLVDLSQDLPSDFEARFDVAFNHTVLEHIFDVRTAFHNLCRLSKDIVIVVVPFAQVQHEVEDFKDYWRFSPAGLRHLFLENGFEVIYEACNNDKNAAVYLFFVGSRRPEYWRDQMPPFQPVNNAGAWIGAATPPLGFLGRLRLAIKILIDGNVSH